MRLFLAGCVSAMTAKCNTYIVSHERRPCVTTASRREPKMSTSAVTGHVAMPDVQTPVCMSISMVCGM